MTEVLSSKEVDIKLAEIASRMRKHWNDFNHNLGMGHDSLMVCADRKIHHLRAEWDKTLLTNGITCEREYCKKTSPLAQWNFFCEKDQSFSVNTVKIKCPCCGSVFALADHPMSARVVWIVDHAYALPWNFFPSITNDINELYSKTVSWRQGSFEKQM